MKKIYTFLILLTIQVYAQPYPQLSTDISWSPGNFNTVADIEAAFENGRIQENVQLNPDISTDLVMPSQVDWDAKSHSEKALYLINAERVARGLLPFEAVSNNIVTIAQNYADFLRTNNLFGHNLNGSPSDRLNSDPSISGCSESGWIFGPENLSNYASTNPDPPALPIERAVYGWIYADAGSTWGHRNTCFALFNNNFGSALNEGFIGVGYSQGAYTFFGDPFNFGAVVVFNFVDPCPTSPLPVELTSFTLNLSENKIELNWETATEVNNYGFEIERLKTNIIIKDSEWEKIGFVEGHGNSNSPKYYSFKDNLLETSGKYSYRLKQIDIDGTFEYSDIVETNVSSPQNFELRQNYPNPFNPVTSITYSIPNDGHVELGIYDILGNEVEIVENGIKPAGSYTFSFDASKLTSGIYFYKIKTNNFISIKKMMLMK
ncbi:MAG: T9SS type A sorting domain-containing protein [Ignavibacteriae bacterium]|nr:T9SS type A sorting domain-containing protein [Ignavibacteriota bacterium]